MNINEALKESIQSSLIDGQDYIQNRLSPRLVINNQKADETVLEVLQSELKVCKNFSFTIAFISYAGLAALKTVLYDLAIKGVKGRIITSNYLAFNSPKMYRELLKIKNLEVRISDSEGFHSKGYIFDHGNYQSIMIGSSNLTRSALMTNYEWNFKISSNENGKVVEQINGQFEDEWKSAVNLTPDLINQYEKKFLEMKKIEAEVLGKIKVEKSEVTIAPNSMQKVALVELETLRNQGEKKALVISATGTGKTYLAAFDVQNVKPKRFLFIVHREQILLKALECFKDIIGGDERDYGILTGNQRDYTAKYLFSTVQTISKEEVRTYYGKEYFDYIIIDESHRAAANSYLDIVNYFNPKFLLGMTATPERTDELNIYDLFDFNVAYEIRLQEALEADMLVPFYYFGVVDYEKDGVVVDDNTKLKNLIESERVEHIIEKINYYGFDGDKVHGLIFCSLKEEARSLAEELTARGLKTKALTGEDSIKTREKVICELEEGQIDYIVTVDLFSEGIDIPCINQIIMLRHTKSSIVFIQQLGRGLRKYPEKEFLTVIDFIGNYKNNFLIPIALNGDKSLNKGNLKDYLSKTVLSGVSVINFERIAEARVYEAITVATLDSMKELKELFLDLKYRLNRVPLLKDFIENDSIDPIIIASKKKNYYAFLKTMKENFYVESEGEEILNFLTQELLTGKRTHELIVLKYLIEYSFIPKQEISSLLQSRGIAYDEAVISSVISVLTFEFFKSDNKNPYGHISLLKNDSEKLELSDTMVALMKGDSSFHILVDDIIETGLCRGQRYKNGGSLSLYERYTRKDFCRLMNWSKDESSTIYGYRIKHNTCPIFVTYEKDAIDYKYKDTLIAPDVLSWYSKTQRNLNSKDIMQFRNIEKENLEMHLFIKKDESDKSEFYYLGKCSPIKDSFKEEIHDDKPIVNMLLKLENEIEPSLYHSLTRNL
ncbi:MULTISPECIES: DEAD/DEAH box helicase [unclassified Listeria]|uniref:DEAD/DEAH box helicase n=1 Tax=unclassified Listeria TaxID=2642072 RepID=UPI000B597254|nr:MULTISPECIES: DEAD/DEAH box helicase [unclassified Listeria]